MAWEEVTGYQGELVTLEVGDFFEGKLIDVRKGKFGNVYDFEDTQGNIKTIFGTSVLDSRLSEELRGKKVRIERTADLPPEVRGHNPTKMFKVPQRELGYGISLG